jgi:hypothetical protein
LPRQFRMRTHRTAARCRAAHQTIPVIDNSRIPVRICLAGSKR